MEEIAKNFEARRELVQQALKNAAAYIKEIDPVLQGSDAAAYTQTHAALATLADSTALESKQWQAAETRAAFKYVALCESALQILQRVLDDPGYTRALYATRSQKFTVDMKMRQAHFRAAAQEFATHSDALVFDKIFEKFTVPELVDAALAVGPDLDRFVIELLNRANRVATGPTKTKVVAIIEAKKDQALGAEARIMPQGSGPGSLIMRQGLVAAGKFKPVEMWALKWGVDPGPLLFDRIAVAVSRPLWVLDNSVGTPVEFQLRSLIDDEYLAANGWTAAATSGLNHRILKRPDTARRVAAGPPTDARTTIFGKNFVTKPIILETQDGGITYRRLDSTHHIDPDGIPGRWAAYRDLVEPPLDPKSDMLLQEYLLAANAPRPSVEPVTQALIAQLTEHFSARFQERAAKLEAQDHDKVAQLIEQILGSHRPDSTTMTPDLALSEVARIDRLTQEFIKELEKALGQQPPARWFKELRREDLWQQLLEHHRQRITAAVDIISRLGMWESESSSLKEYVFRARDIIY